MRDHSNLVKGVSGLLLCALLLCSAASAWCEEAGGQPPDRKKIGLVLSGGGARGLSHIGALEWMEEHRIPVDYLTGTSMGGLVGGLYAMGMSPKEMREFIRGIDWARVFGSGIRYEDLSFRRKQDRRQYQVDMELGLKNGLSVPSGLSTGHQVGLLIDRATLPYYHLASFDSLPIPFRCMGTDMIAAQPVVMSDGLISTAMRATMSLPGIFPPVLRNQKWLIDGGVLNNIPTDVMRDTFHPDVTIAINVGTPLGNEKKALQSMFGVISQTIGVMTYGSDAERLKLAQVVVSPELGPVTVTDFDDPDGTADIGYKAAEAAAAQLLPYSVDEETWSRYLAARNEKRQKSLPVPKTIEVTGVSEKEAQYIRTRLLSFAGTELNIHLLELKLTQLAGEGRYQSIDYGFVQSESGQADLLIRVTPKTYAPPTVNLNLALEGSDISDFNIGLGTRVTFYDTVMFNSEWRNDINIGYQSHFSTEYYLPVLKSGFFVAPFGYYVRGKESLYAGGQRMAEYNVDNYGISADIGYLTWRNEIRLGYEFGRVDASLASGTSDYSELKGKQDFAHLSWTFDGLNSGSLPDRGTRISASAEYFFSSPQAESEFPQAQIAAVHFFPVSARGRILAEGTLETTFDKNAAPARKFSLGGPLRLSAYDPDEFVGNHAVLASVGYMHRIAELPPLLGGKIWLVGVYSIGSAFDDFDKTDFKNQGSVAVAIDTRFGPFLLLGAVGQDGNSNIYFSFGKFF